MAKDMVKSFFGGGTVADRINKAKKLRKGVHVEKAKKGSEFPFLGTANGDALFVYGQDKAPVPEGTLWAANIATAETGWAYWASKKKTQQLASIWDENPINLDDLPEPHESHDSKGNPIVWGPAYAWQLAAVNGPLKGLTVAYEGNSNYMLDISEQLILTSANRMEESEACFPIIRLFNDPYPNADTGAATSKHKFELFGWGTIDGEIDEWVRDEPEVQDGKKKAPAKKRTRRTAA